MSMPSRALKDLDRHLPKLDWLILASPKVHSANSQQLLEYVDACMLALQRSSSLANMSLRLDKEVVAECQPGGWEQVPPNLHNFGSDCAIDGMHHATALLRGLHRLTMPGNCCSDILQLLRAAPDLIQLHVNPPASWVLWCDRADAASGIISYKERVLTDLCFVIKAVQLAGISESIEAALAALPPLRCVKRVVLNFNGDPGLQCLANMASVSPDLNELWLFASYELVGLALDVNMLEPVAARTSLEQLHIHMQLSLGTPELIGLCMRMPRHEVAEFPREPEYSFCRATVRTC